MRDPWPIALLLLATAGCIEGPEVYGARPVDCPTQGAGGRAAFGYSVGGGCRADWSLDVPIVEGGAVGISIVVEAGRTVGSVSLSAPDVATFTLGSIGGLPANMYFAAARTARSGSADLVVFDGDGKEIDRATVAVKAADRISLPVERGGGVDPPLVLEGARIAITAHAFVEATELIGTGGIRFSPIGPAYVAPGPRTFDPFGTTVVVSGPPGPSGVHAENGSGSAELTFSTVAGADLTRISIVHPNTWYVEVRGFVGDQGVAGVGCNWQLDSPNLAVARESFGTPTFPAAVRYYFSGPVGDYHPTCAASDGRSYLVDIAIPSKM